MAAKRVSPGGAASEGRAFRAALPNAIAVRCEAKAFSRSGIPAVAL
jgi:hypothetical protein